jgi:predicted HicB family RNase H-like nuclease
MMTQRKPMTFDMNAAQRVPAQVHAEGSDRQQVGARVTKATYRQLKARAALQGGTVQALVEQAIDEFLAKHSG